MPFASSGACARNAPPLPTVLNVTSGPPGGVVGVPVCTTCAVSVIDVPSSIGLGVAVTVVVVCTACELPVTCSTSDVPEARSTLSPL